ncbi:RNA polymerase sigma factor [Singulisphaera sp. PoT]|uniref:RNA polymerase sigma factor n=1 Tax=Singulisphaera sp. PoT TaxID=3411797 RepID=UPI003BF47AD2
MDDSPDTRHSLIVKLRDPADTAAWREFASLYEPLVYRIARRKGLQDADAQDLTQEVFQALARSIDSWDPARGSFRAWVSQITRNLLINLLARGNKFARGSGSTTVQFLLQEQPANDPSATAAFEDEHRRRVFQWAAERVQGEFNPATWQAFWQSTVEGRPPKEVAAELGITLGALYVARSRILSRLKRRIESLGEISAEIRKEVDDEFPL